MGKDRGIGSNRVFPVVIACNDNILEAWILPNAYQQIHAVLHTVLDQDLDILEEPETMEALDRGACLVTGHRDLITHPESRVGDDSCGIRRDLTFDRDSEDPEDLGARLGEDCRREQQGKKEETTTALRHF